MNLRRSALAAAVAALFLAASPVWAGNGQNLLQHMPQSSAVVINVNLEQLRSLPLYQMIWGAVTANPEAQEALAEMQTAAGFDPNTDLSSVMIALSPEDSEKWAVLVEGSFNSEQIISYLSTQPETEMATQEYAGHTVYYDPSEAEADRGYFTFLSDSVLAAGTQAELSAVLDTTGGGAALSANTEMSPLLSSVDTSGAFWFAGVMSPAMQSEMVGSPMEGLSSFYGGGNFESGFNVDYTLGTTTAEQATALAAFLNEQVSQARTAPEIQQMGLGGVLDAVTIAANTTNVNITAAVPEETLNQLMGVLSAIMAAQAGGGMAPPPQ